MFWVGEVQQKAPNVIIFLVATKVEVPLVKGVSPCVGYTVIIYSLASYFYCIVNYPIL